MSPQQNFLGKCNECWFIRPPTELELEVCTKKQNSIHLRIHAVGSEALKKINFPNYEYFKDVNRAYSDFFDKLMTVIDNVAPCIT